MRIFTKVLALLAVSFIEAIVFNAGVSAQRSRPGRRGIICGNPKVPCKTSATFKEYDLPFRVPKNSVIVDTELFYVVILKSVGKTEEDCDVFVPEHERRAAQELFPER